jgi:hypothetical protein
MVAPEGVGRRVSPEDEAMADPAPQIDAIRQELTDAQDRAHRVTETAGDSLWATTPAAGGWSVAECLIHLNVSSTAFLAPIREVLYDGHRRGLVGREPYRLDLAGWFLCRLLEPPARFKVRTPPGFVPVRIDAAANVLSDFDRLQAELLRCLDRARDLPLSRLKVQSPFARRVRYNLYSTFRVIPAHQRRHLWQAEQVLAALR